MATPPDPTYSQNLIKANPEWELAFALSEMDNDHAPVGWFSYVPLARNLRNCYDITRKRDHEPNPRR